MKPDTEPSKESSAFYTEQKERKAQQWHDDNALPQAAGDTQNLTGKFSREQFEHPPVLSRLLVFALET